MGKRVKTDNAGERKPTFASEMRRIGVELAKELGPTMLFLLGLCIGLLGLIQHSIGVEGLKLDDHLRSVGKTTTGVIVEVQKTYSSTRRGATTTTYTPTTLQKIDGIEYKTKLDEYEVRNDSDYYRVGAKLPIMYDEADPQVAGVKLDANRAMFEYREDSGVRFGIAGAVAFVLGTPLLVVQLVRRGVSRFRNRETRKWSKLRRRIKSAGKRP